MIEDKVESSLSAMNNYLWLYKTNPKQNKAILASIGEKADELSALIQYHLKFGEE